MEQLLKYKYECPCVGCGWCGEKTGRGGICPRCGYNLGSEKEGDDVVDRVMPVREEEAVAKSVLISVSGGMVREVLVDGKRIKSSNIDVFDADNLQHRHGTEISALWLAVLHLHKYCPEQVGGFIMAIEEVEGNENTPS